MAIPKEDRITFTKVIVEADSKKASLDQARAEIQKSKDKAYKLDQANKNLVDPKTALIDGYHQELGKITGIFRVALTESDIQDAASFVLGNHLYPNDATNPPPSTAPMVWTKTKPYARNKAVGKQFSETYPAAVAGEQSKTTDVLNKITAMTSAYVQMENTTGQKAETTTGSCSNPLYTTEATCLLNGGTWTPGIEQVVTYPAVQSDMTDLIAKVNDLRAHLLSEQATILTNDPNTTRQAQNNAAISNINTIVAAIDIWLAYPDFNTSHGQTTVAGFYGYNASLLEPTKMSATQRTAFVSALTTRQTFASTRETQVNTNLGSITQNLSTGDCTGSGLYFERWAFIQLRLNIIGGSLLEYKNFDRAISAQDDFKANTDLAKNTYSLLLKTSILSAPTNGTKIVHVKTSAGLAVGDNVFIVSDTQEELVRTIEAINGNAITVGQPVPAKYRPVEFARLYKDIS